MCMNVLRLPSSIDSSWRSPDLNLSVSEVNQSLAEFSFLRLSDSCFGDLEIQNIQRSLAYAASMGEFVFVYLWCLKFQAVSSLGFHLAQVGQIISRSGDGCAQIVACEKLWIISLPPIIYHSFRGWEGNATLHCCHHPPDARTFVHCLSLVHWIWYYSRMWGLFFFAENQKLRPHSRKRKFHFPPTLPLKGCWFVDIRWLFLHALSSYARIWQETCSLIKLKQASPLFPITVIAQPYEVTAASAKGGSQALLSSSKLS